MHAVNKYSKFEKCVNILLPLTPILQLYGWSPFDFAFIATILLFIWSLFIPYKKNIMPKYLSGYLWYYLIAYVIGGLISGSLELPLGWLKIVLIYMFFFKSFKINLLNKYYSIVVYVCTAYLYFQTIILNISGIKINGIADWLPLTLDNLDASEYIAATLKDYWRVCSFFSEPAKFAQFLIPYFAITLFSKSKLRVFNIILTTTTLLLLRSGNAMLIAGVILLCYIIYSLFSKWSIKKFVGLFLTFCGFVIVGSYYITSDSANELIERQNEISGVDYHTSGFFRIFRGYYVFEELPDLEKIIGANNTTLMDKAISKCKVSFLFSPHDYYYNTVQNILIKTGIIGAAIFILMLAKLFKNSNPAGKTIIVALISVSFIASMYLSYMMLLYLIFAYGLKRNSIQ